MAVKTGSTATVRLIPELSPAEWSSVGRRERICVAHYTGTSTTSFLIPTPMPISAKREANLYRQWAACLYRWASYRQRIETRRHLIASCNFPVGILFYHRVADAHPTPWTISRRNFVAHLDYLERNFQIVSLAEAQRRVRSPHNSQPSVAITFDDGYAENCDFAIPELQRRGLPATYFVATSSVVDGVPFRHDLYRNCPLTPNTVAEVQDIACAGFEIGGHTKNHIDLGQLATRDMAAEEILGGIEELESWGVGPIRYFSFPYGLPQNTSQVAVNILLEAGLHGFCTAYGAWNWPGQAGYHLRRIHADPGMQTLKNWLTFDSRKLRDQHPLPFTEPVWPHDSSSAALQTQSHVPLCAGAAGPRPLTVASSH